MANGAVPVSVAVIVDVPPAQTVPPPLTAGEGIGLKAMVALTPEVALQFASEIEVIVYVVFDDGAHVLSVIVALPLAVPLQVASRILVSFPTRRSSDLTVREAVVPPATF